MKIIATGGIVATLLLSSFFYAQDGASLGDIARKIRAEKSASQTSGSASQSPKQEDGQNADSAQSGAIGNFAFSPDGLSILLSRSHATSSFLYKVALDTGRASRLTSASSGFS
jgi:Tol biopolymer transport system component